MWINFLHSNAKWFDVAERYKLRQTTAMNYVVHVLKAILKAFHGTKDIISVPSLHNQNIMHDILINKGETLPHGLFIVDGTHKRTLGKNDADKRSYKFKWRAAKSFMFVIDRIQRKVCGISLGHPPRNNDITIWKQSMLNKNINSYFDKKYPILGDPGYIGANSTYMAAMCRTKKRKTMSRGFCKAHCKARVKVEHFFGYFFRNQFPKLANWFCTGKNALILWNIHILCAIILTNTLSLLS